VTKYGFTLNIDDLLEIEGWCELTISWDLDGEPQGIDVDAVEIDTTVERDREINRGQPIIDNLPDNRLWDEIRLRLIEHLNDVAGAWDDCMSAAERQGDIPDMHDHAMRRHEANYSQPY